MRVRLIMAQYKCAYPGQYAPNVVDAWDEYCLEDNWEGYVESVHKHQAMVPRDYDSVRELDIFVPESVIDQLFSIPNVNVDASPFNS